MIKHIVMFKLKTSIPVEKKSETLIKVKENFESLKNKIPEIHFYEVGLNISESPAAYDFVIHSDFKTLEDLQKYSAHPEHVKAVEFNRKYTESRTVVDFKY